MMIVKDITILEMPVSYTAICEHLRIDEGSETTHLSDINAAATDIAEDYIEQHIALKEITIEGNYSGSGTIVFTDTNIKEIVEVKIDGTVTENYTRTNDGNKVSITLPIGTPAEFVITYKAGLGVKTPSAIKSAIKIKIGELYDADRSGYVLSNQRPTGNFERILNHHKPIYFR